jgi:para-nitrobenzyl esterase
VGCPDQTAACLRQLPVSALVSPNYVVIPGVVDGRVLTEPIGTALAAGRFARVPVLNGTNHDEERIFVSIGLTVSQGTDVPIAETPINPGNYQANIAAALGVTAARAAEIAAEYPLTAYPFPWVAFSTLVGDASFAARRCRSTRRPPSGCRPTPMSSTTTPRRRSRRADVANSRGTTGSAGPEPFG